MATHPTCALGATEDMILPLEYRWIKAHKFEGLTPWYFIDPMDTNWIREEFKKETNREFVPFARRQDMDDFAGFEVVNGEVISKIITVHLTWSGALERDGFPKRRESSDVFKWISEVVIPATKEWMSEEELTDLIDEN